MAVAAAAEELTSTGGSREGGQIFPEALSIQSTFQNWIFFIISDDLKRIKLMKNQRTFVRRTEHKSSRGNDVILKSLRVHYLREPMKGIINFSNQSINLSPRCQT